MSELKAITCAACGATTFEHDAEGNLICTHCGTKYASPREQIICPACGTENPAGAVRCMKCGLNLGKLCPTCNYANAPGAENCVNCGSPLDALASISMRHGAGKRLSDEMREQRLVQQKGVDTAYLAQQMKSIEADEHARQQQLAAQQAESKRQQTIVMIVGIGIVVCLIGVSLAISLFLSSPH
jgi:ribosomal protein L40E